MPFGVKRDAPPWEGLLRAMGMVFVFMGVIWLFWKHSQRTMDMLDAHQIVVDQGGQLTEEQRRSVRDLSRALKASFGMDLQLVIATKPLSQPVVDAKTIYIGLFPEGEQVLVILPPIMERALGHGFTRHLRQEHFGPYWASGNWQRGLGEALGMIWNALNSPEDEYDVERRGMEELSSGGSYRGMVRNEGWTE